jgi:hypothetical protein
MTFLSRRTVSFALIVCVAGAPSFLLACAAMCVPGMMTHGAMAVAAPDSESAQALPSEHTHHAMPAEQSPARTAAHHSEQPVAGVDLAATFSDLVDSGCCDHTGASVTTATPGHRADAAAVVGSGTTAVAILAASVPGIHHVRATPFGQSLPPQPLRSLLVLRI